LALVTTHHAAADDFSFAGRYRTMDFKDVGFLQVSQVSTGRWSLAISDRQEPPAEVAGGPGQLPVVTASSDVLRQHFSESTDTRDVRCIAYAPPINVLILCSAPPATTLHLRTPLGSVSAHTTATGYVAFLGSQDGQPPRDLRRQP
jgi:hypothetical protein